MSTFPADSTCMPVLAFGGGVRASTVCVETQADVIGFESRVGLPGVVVGKEAITKEYGSSMGIEPLEISE